MTTFQQQEPEVRRPSRRFARDRGDPVVEVRDVTVVYPGGNVGLDGASVTIDRGEFAFLVGPTGCGKSTFIRLLMREIEAARGQMMIAGRDIGTLPRKRTPMLRRNIGVVFQDYKLLPNRTVYDNVAYCLQVIGARRSRLARAFPTPPPLLLADEPTGNLDPETSIGIMQLLYRMNRTGTTVIVATHDREMVDRMRRRVIELKEGRIVRDERSGLYRPDETTREFAARLQD